MSSPSNTARRIAHSGRFVVGILVLAILLGTAISVYLFQISEHAFDDGTICRENLRELGRALFAYQDRHSVFPPAYLANGQGAPINSWRTVLLPFLSQEDARRLAEFYNLREPWNSKENTQAQASFMPLAYKCPALTRPRLKFGHAHFLAIVGETTAWPGSTGIAVKRSGRRILLIEYAKDDIVWTEPKDVKLAELTAAPPGTPLAQFGIGSPTGSPPYALYSDGSVERLPEDTTVADLVRAVKLE